MSQQPNDDGLVPPIKVLRKRLNGVYSAEGLTGPTRRYVLLVVMLVGLASLPTLAAITAGSNELADGGSTVTDVPFIPPASSGPVRIPPSSAGTDSPGPPIQGQAQNRKTRPSGYAGSTRHRSAEGEGTHRRGLPAGWAAKPGKSHRPLHRDESDEGAGGSGPGVGGSDPDTGDDGRGVDQENDGDDPQNADGGDSQGDDGNGSQGDDGNDSQGGADGGSDSDGDDSQGDDDGWQNDDGWGRDDDSGDQDQDQDQDQGQDPQDPDDDPDLPPVEPVRPPWCADRSQCSSRPSHHHRPDRSPHKQCEDANHRAHWSHHQEGRRRIVTVHIEPTGRHGRRSTVTETRRAEQPKRLKKIVSHRWAAPARSDTSRRSAMAERPQNVKSAADADRTHNSHRHHRTADARAYRGSHRAESMHRTGGSYNAALQRSSRPGRHHADPDHTNRW
ncbi:hypothetical protein [Actinoplanes sp. NPDC049681]|uniref:hypothetical protein n=1 Tax=Actinoplanes sp. NPDC049681 TaxID=3363905 RepID=UPI003792B496